MTTHFAAVEPTSVRLLTMKDNPTKCKGYAFLEFARYDKMELCLSKFHHSMFNDGKSEPRKINVELTYVFPPQPWMDGWMAELTVRDIQCGRWRREE